MYVIELKSKVDFKLSYISQSAKLMQTNAHVTRFVAANIKRAKRFAGKELALEFADKLSNANIPTFRRLKYRAVKVTK